MKKIYFLAFISFLFFFSMPVLATIGPEPSSGVKDYIAPSIPTNVQLIHQTGKILITWTDPTETDFYRIEFLRNEGGNTPVTGLSRGSIGKGIEKYEDAEVQEGWEYIYRLKVVDLSSNTRLSEEYATVKPVAAESVSEVKVVVEETKTEVVPPTAKAVEVFTTPNDTAALLNNFSLTRDEAKEIEYKALVKADAVEFQTTMDATQESAAVNFVTYGISAKTQALGAGERRALLRDYLETVGRGNVSWEDLERMAIGQKPVSRNLAKEQAKVAQVLKTFTKIYGRAPNFQDPKEDLFWNTMMYRIRFTRDLTKENDGIKEFRRIFKRTPAAPLDWSVVRGLGYVLK